MINIDQAVHTRAREFGADRNGLVFGYLLLQQGASDRGGDLGVDLVGGDLQEGLVDVDGVTNLLEPTRHGAFSDRLTQGR